MQYRRILACLLLASAMIQPALANNITVSNVTITDQDSVTKTANIVFDLSWENSWRLNTGPANWDAAWVFVKYHNGDGVWRHAKLLTPAASHFVPAGATLSVGLTGTTGMGAFIHRSAPGSGNVSWSGIKLKWHYGADNILDSALITADVQAIEMVYVPEGSYYLGDGGDNAWSRGDILGSPYLVTSAADIQVGNTSGEINQIRVSGPGTGSASDRIIPYEYPNGYTAFYCMKYEVSQGQYARYSNMGGYGSFSGGGTRQTATGSPPNLVASTPDRAYGFGGSSNLSNLQILYYLNWTGLRPMTECEYEKACRGSVYPVPGEYAWGTAVVASLAYSLSADGTATEAVSANYNESAGNAWTLTTRGSLSGPCRVGMFAKATYNGSTSPRIQSGSSYWGIMDLSGNVSEMTTPIVMASPYTGTPADPQNYVLRGTTYYSYPATNFRGSHGTGGGVYPPDWTHLTVGTSGPSAWKTSSYDTNQNNGFHKVSATPETAQFVIKGIRGVRSAP